MHTRAAGLLALLSSGCTPGTIAWSTGEDDLRTAMYTVDPETERIRLFLSNGDLGDLGCYMPAAEGDAGAVAEAWDRMWFALCREDARHVYVDLHRPVGSDVVGPYAGDSDGLPEETETLERWTRGFYAGIDEATTRSGDSLVQDYDVVRATWGVLGDGGEVAIDGADEEPPDGDWTAEATVTAGIRGTFSFPDLHVSGEFGARMCQPRPDRTTLLDFLATIGFTPESAVDPAVWCNL